MGQTYDSYSSGLRQRFLAIGDFNGIDQSRGEHNSDYGSAYVAENWICRDGELRTARGCSEYGQDTGAVVSSGKQGRLFQAFARNSNGEEISKLIVCAGGKIFAADLDAAQWTLIGEGFQSDNWDDVHYRDEDCEWIILANGVDHPQYWDCSSEATGAIVPVQGNTGEAGTGEEITFSKITLLYERLWGAVSSEYPDRIYWSSGFDAEDWEFNYNDPDNEGGGFTDVATFDGTRIRAIVSAFDEVMIFKDKSVHRLSGTYPGEFSLTQVYGTDSTLAPRSIVYNGSVLYFLSEEGLCAYNGMSVYSLASQGDRKIKDIWARVNAATVEKACAVLKDNIIYLAVPLDGANHNTHVIEYDLRTGVYSLVALDGVDDWLLMREGQQETMLYLNGGKVYRYAAGYTMYGDAIHASWLSPQIRVGTLLSRKQTGRLYMLVTARSLDVNRSPQIKITLLSQGKVRSKTIKLNNGQNILRKRIKIRGRTFQFKIENVSGDPLTIHRGVQLAIEEDFD